MGQQRTRQIAAREVVDALDQLIKLRINLFNLTQYPQVNANLEEIELLKRELTDFFLAVDGRPGIYVKGPND